jgi:protein-tyrosine kinase
MLKQGSQENSGQFVVDVRPISSGGWLEDDAGDDERGEGRGPLRHHSFAQPEQFPVVVRGGFPRRLLAERWLAELLPDEGALEPVRNQTLSGGVGRSGPRGRRQTDEQIVRRVGGTASHEMAQPSARLVLPRSTEAPAQGTLPVTLREGLVELRAELLLAAQAERVQTVMLCGVEPGDGASFVAWHLSRLCAEFERLRVALLVVEGRRAVASRRGNAAQDFGLLLRRTESPNLHEVVSPRGSLTLAELLAAAEPGALLARMKQQFDLIVIDGPPVASSADAALLAARVDGVILVARRNVTPLKRLDRAHGRLTRARARVLGLVFNRHG